MFSTTFLSQNQAHSTKQAIQVFSELAKDTEASEPDVLKYEYFVETNGERGKQNVIIHEIRMYFSAGIYIRHHFFTD